jgi:nitrogen-specific signal transduction histidine kinase
MAKTMLCTVYGDSHEQAAPDSRDMSGLVHHRIQFHSGCSAYLQLPDHPGAPVMETRKSPYGLAVNAAASPLQNSGEVIENLPPLQMKIPELQTRASVGPVFESSGEALLVLDTEGIIHQANSRAYELPRSDATRIPGKNLSALISGQSTRDLATSCALASNSTFADSAYPTSFVAFWRTGFPVRITFRAWMPDSGGLLACVEDGAIVRKAHYHRRQTTAELKSVLDSVETGIILLNLSGRVRFSNDRFAQLFGLPPLKLTNLDGYQELKALVAERFRNPESFGAPRESFKTGAGVATRDELEMTRPTRRALERFSRPVVDGDSHAVGWLEVYYDVTGDRRIQSKLLQTEKMPALGQLVSGIAHELNNPLTTIMGDAQLLLGHGLLPSQFSDASKIFQEAERASHIVKNLLCVARENKPERTRVNLNEIVESTLALRSYELKIENIVVECDLAETVGDPYQLQQVVLNLLVNAEQALLQGRGRGRVWIRTVQTGAGKYPPKFPMTGLEFRRESPRAYLMHSSPPSLRVWERDWGSPSSSESFNSMMERSRLKANPAPERNSSSSSR